MTIGVCIHFWISRLGYRIGQSPQNFNKKLKRGTVSFEEMMAIAEALNVEYEQAFILPNGKKINIRNKNRRANK